MAILVDTNVVSELNKLKPNRRVLQFISDVPSDELHISIVNIAEIRYGILIADQETHRDDLRRWLEDSLIPSFHGRILPVSETVWVRWRLIVAQGRKANRTYPQPDLFLAATAIEHNLTLVTRNTRDFSGIPGLQLLNPWE